MAKASHKAEPNTQEMGEADSPGVGRMSKSHTRVQPREGRSTGGKDATRPVSLMVRPVCFFYVQLKTS